MSCCCKEDILQSANAKKRRIMVTWKSMKKPIENFLKSGIGEVMAIANLEIDFFFIEF